MNRYIVPRFGFVLVAGLAATLISIVARSPDTHGNVWGQVPPDYTRTEVAVVGENGASGTLPVAAVPSGSRIALALPDFTFESAATPLDPGKRIYVQAGCATCHGVDAQGGPVGPSLAGSLPKIVKHMVRDGPGGMPAYTAAHLSDTDLDRLADYLGNLPVVKPNSAEIASIPSLTWDPSTPLSVILRGKVAVRRSCGACHPPPNEEKVREAFASDFDATSVVASMAARHPNLTLEDARAIAYYMMAVLHGVDLVKAP